MSKTSHGRRVWLRVLAAGTGLAFSFASACTITSTDDGQEDDGASSGETSSGETNSTSSGSGGGSGAGGGEECSGCGNLWTGVEPDDDTLCGVTEDNSCEPGTSCELFDVILDCVCDPASGCVDEFGEGPCADACDPDAEDAIVYDDCEACGNAACVAEVDECLAD